MSNPYHWPLRSRLHRVISAVDTDAIYVIAGAKVAHISVDDFLATVTAGGSWTDVLLHDRLVSPDKLIDCLRLGAVDGSWSATIISYAATDGHWVVGLRAPTLEDYAAAKAWTVHAVWSLDVPGDDVIHLGA